MNLVKKIADKEIQIIYRKSGEKISVCPKVVENCMIPGTFSITPIELWEDADRIEYRIGQTSISLSKNEIADNEVLCEESPFVPEIVRPKNSCNPCRNCGRC